MIGLLAASLIPYRLAAQVYPNQYETTCPAGSTVVSGPTGSSYDPATGKYRANFCIDANGNVTLQSGAILNGNNAFTGNNTTAILNGSRVVDGTKYAITAAGIQAALNDQAAAGGGTVLIQPGGALSIYVGNPLTVSGSPIAMGSTTLTIPSHVRLIGSAEHSGTVLRWTSTPSGAHSGSIVFAAGTQYGAVENLTLSFSSGTSGASGIAADANVSNITAWNAIRNVFVNFESCGGTGSSGIFAPATLNSFSFVLNTFDNIIVSCAAQFASVQSAEGNFWKGQCFNCGVASGTLFSEIQSNDEQVDVRMESGSGSGTNGVCYANSGQGNIVRLTCDATAAGWTALNDAPPAGGNTYQLSLIGTATLGTLASTSTATVNQPSGGNQFITATVGPSKTQQHTIPVVASDTLALLAAPQTLTNKTLNVPLPNGTGLQIFNTTTTCTTGASVGATCTTAAISLPIAEADTAYRVTCTGKGLTNVPVVIATTNSSATQFTITIAALTAAAASFASYDCLIGHN